MPTKTMEVFRVQDQGSKMVLDSVLTTHERVVQVGTVRELKGYCFSGSFPLFFSPSVRLFSSTCLLAFEW
jgi:hypothetical protein